MPRQCTIGAGGKHRYDLRGRLLMTVFWLRTYTTCEVLGVLYELNKNNIEDNLKDILATLDGMTTFIYDRPEPGYPELRSVGVMMEGLYRGVAGDRCQGSAQISVESLCATAGVRAST